MEIIAASIFDLNSLRRIEQACFEKDAWPVLDLIAVLTFPDVIRLKAVVDNQMVGFVAGDPRPRDGWAWISTIGVHPDYQRRGIGRSLLRACENKLTTPRLRLTVRMSNRAAISLYEQEGYKTIDVWGAYYSDREDGVVMEKTIQERH